MTYKKARDSRLIEALADTADTPEKAKNLLEDAGLPTRRLPTFGTQPAGEFWRSVCRELGKGIVSNGLILLVQAAAEEFSDHPTFSAVLEAEAVVAIDGVTEAEAAPWVAEIVRASGNEIEKYRGASEFEALTALLTEILGKLEEPGKSAAAKLKVTLPFIPLIAALEMELDLESSIGQVWQKVKAFTQAKLSRPA